VTLRSLPQNLLRTSGRALEVAGCGFWVGRVRWFSLLSASGQVTSFKETVAFVCTLLCSVPIHSMGLAEGDPVEVKAGVEAGVMT
jgi:hypothetical protein